MEWGINLNIKNKGTSIKVKTLSYLVIFCVGILFFLWLFQIAFLNYAYEKYQIKIVNKVKNIVEKDISLDLETLAYENEICIEIISNNEAILYNSKMNGCGLGRKNPQLTKLLNDFVLTNKKSTSINLVDNDRELKSVVSFIKKDNSYIVLYSSLEDISGASVILKGQLIYIVIVVILLSIAISFFLSKKITEPILDISEKAKQLGKGKYDIAFSHHGVKEIDNLSDTLNNVLKELSRTDELRRDLMANVSHDLKTPLTMIKAYAEMIKDISYKDKKKLNENIDIIISETDRLNGLVNDILELSKMQSDPLNLNIEQIDLVTEINNIISKYAIIKETEKYIFVTEMPLKALINADKKKLEQVIYNLLNNAINYTGKDKKITIKVKEEKKSYLIEIIDTGKGIKESDLPYIWDKYYKNEKNHQRNVVGTGIGLSIVKEVLELHNFNYGVKSIKGKGTTFYFEIKK